jgi:hypothetical protein
MAIKYTNLIRFKTLKNLPNFVFKIYIWQPYQKAAYWKRNPGELGS